MLTSSEYKEYCRKFAKIEEYMHKYSKEQSKTLKEICILRKYYPERMYDTLKEAGFFYIEDSEKCIHGLKKVSKDFGLFSDKGNFRLEGRYIFPVRDMLGNTIALIGWYPDEKKYVTTPSKLFSKSCLFYGMEQLGVSGLGKSYLLTEGIFDTLSARSVGMRCLGQMGIETSRYKRVMYSFFSRVLAVPDNDPEGRKVIAEDSWEMPRNGKYFRWVGDTSKDLDVLCNSYEYEDVQELLQNALQGQGTGKVITVRL